MRNREYEMPPSLCEYEMPPSLWARLVDETLDGHLSPELKAEILTQRRHSAAFAIQTCQHLADTRSTGCPRHRKVAVKLRQLVAELESLYQTKS